MKSAPSFQQSASTSTNGMRVVNRISRVRGWMQSRLGRLSNLHNDQRGSISIVTVFVLLMFTMLLVMIVNVGTHIDDKLKMQNAADASTYSGGIVLARGMNGLAYTNHLLSDVFAMTAFLREGRDRNAEQLVPTMLGSWTTAGADLERAPLPKFSELGAAIGRRVPREQDVVTAYGELNQASAEMTLPVFESILQEKMIGNFQRELILTCPEVAQAVADEVARRHGLMGSSDSQAGSSYQNDYEQKRGRQFGVLWNTSAVPLQYVDQSDPLMRTLPAIDPDVYEDDYYQLIDAEDYKNVGKAQRRALAKLYLERWNLDRLRLFQHESRMSLYFYFWRIATCGHLEDLLTLEYPDSNLPMVLRKAQNGEQMETTISRAETLIPDRPLHRRRYSEHPMVMDNLRSLLDLNEYVDQNFHFVGVVYRRHRKELGPGLFQNPLHENSDAQTFSQVRLFIPRPRTYRLLPGDGIPGGAVNQDNQTIGLGGTFGFTSTIEVPRQRRTAGGAGVDPLRERWVLEGWPTHFDLLNQNWMVQLVPGTTDAMPQILSSNPGGDLAGFRPPNLGDVDNSVMKRVNNH